eukprot:4916086-Pyramimonas_sp.AAC.1
MEESPLPHPAVVAQRSTSTSATTATEPPPTSINMPPTPNHHPCIFVTGFPGFLASALVESLLKRFPSPPSSDDDYDDHHQDDEGGVVLIHCVVQPRFRALAEERALEFEKAHANAAQRIILYNGDITRADLGLEDCYADLAKHVTEIFHLAAVTTTHHFVCVLCPSMHQASLMHDYATMHAPRAAYFVQKRHTSHLARV